MLKQVHQPICKCLMIQLQDEILAEPAMQNLQSVKGSSREKGSSQAQLLPSTNAAGLLIECSDLTMWILAGAAMKGSLEMAAMSSPSEKSTALQGSWNWKVNRHSPVSVSHNRAELSAEPVMSRDESTAQPVARVTITTLQTAGLECPQKRPAALCPILNTATATTCLVICHPDSTPVHVHGGCTTVSSLVPSATVSCKHERTALQTHPGS